MAEHEWFGALSRIVSRKWGRKKGEFAVAFEERLASAAAEGAAPETLDRAREVGRYAAAWIDGIPLLADDHWRAAVALRNLRTAGLPAALVEATLARMPARLAIPADIATQAIMSEHARWWLEFLVARKYLPLPKLLKLAKARPADFYRSVGLDVLVLRQKSCPRVVWLPLARGVKRPDGLLAGEDAFVRSFLVDTAADASRWFCAFALSVPDGGKAVLTALLRHPAAACRVAAYVGSAIPSEPVAKGRKAGAVLPNLAEALLAHAYETPGEPHKEVAVQVADLLQVLGSIAPRGAARAPVDAAARQAGDLAALRTSSALLRAEGDGRDDPDELIVARVEALYRGVQQYLRDLPVAIGGEALEPERVRRLSRYEGQRDVLGHVLSAMDEVPEAGALRDALDAALFSLGVRAIGTVGEMVAMVPELHEPATSGAMPGASVVILRPGRRLGSGDGHVLVRARVTLPA